MSRPRLFSSEQVSAWRREYSHRQRVIRSTRSLERLAKDAGVNMNAMRDLLSGRTYKDVSRG